MIGRSKSLNDLGSTQSNDSFNQLVSVKAPKSRHYNGGSCSLQNRLSTAVLEKNEGYGYLSKQRRNKRGNIARVDQYPSHSTNHGIKRKKKADELNKAELWDPHSDLPPDLLHCRYLGDIWILLSSMLSCSTDLQKENIQLALNSAEWNGFHHKCRSSFIRYHRSSQGKDFKAFAPIICKRKELYIVKNPGMFNFIWKLLDENGHNLH
ncbi:Hypothetical predicted protein [Mytilus galloprovincialis]|uniref:Uncharacterized protein n=1 Tax=Mytilus galloprovincialis TaxID=29158 RepID=A0A8B6DB13_MYTGA|nr:Hypothetical predicted protein [Mytilus galloprovincialis]